jgi:hypothetical protein
MDPESIDPRRILAEIAVDTSAPAAARVAACKILNADAPKTTAEQLEEMDPITKRAIESLRAQSRRLN